MDGKYLGLTLLMQFKANTQIKAFIIYIFISFRKMLSLGKSRPWPEVLEVLAETQTLSSEPIIAYFKPLEDWLDEHRKLNKYELGW